MKEEKSLFPYANTPLIFFREKSSKFRPFSLSYLNVKRMQKGTLLSPSSTPIILFWIV